MVRDGVANIVDRLGECGLEPRRVGDDAWEARCPAHRSADHALAITRNEFNHVVLECRSRQNCQHFRIIGALGLTNDHVYAETPDWLIERTRQMPIQPVSFGTAGASGTVEERPSAGERASQSAAAPLAADGEPSADLVEAGKPSSSEVFRCQQEAGAADDRPAEGTVLATITSSAIRDTAVARVAGWDGDPTAPAFSPAGTALQFEQTRGHSVEFLVSSISVTPQTGGKPERASSVQVLSRLASGARLFRSADGRFCAQVPVGERLEIFGLRSAGFRDWLIDGYMNDQAEPPSTWAIRRVIGMLEARARFSVGLPEVFVRVGQVGEGNESTYFVDLGDPSGRAVAIRDQGWSVVDRPAVHFRRPEGLLPLPLPARDGSIDSLRSYVNLTEPDFRLMIAWLTAALRPLGPYPILVLNGEQSSGKSTLARILRMLIDPQACPVLALPNSTHDLMATALNGWVLIYENISSIANWLSDCICQLAFGGGFAGRELFTNDERSVIYAQRPVILVVIDDFVLRGDLRDRSVFLHLPPIPHTSRRTERTIWPAFRADYPRILGGVFDAIAGGLRELPSVDLKELPRMADFAEWGEATGRGLGWGASTFISAYNDNRKEATELLLDDSQVAAVLIGLGRVGVNWSGTPMELYRSIVEGAGRKLGRNWPKTISTFGSELHRIAPQLRLHGISVGFERRRGERIVTLRADHVAASQTPQDSGKP